MTIYTAVNDRALWIAENISADYSVRCVAGRAPRLPSDGVRQFEKTTLEFLVCQPREGLQRSKDTLINSHIRS